MVITDWTGAHVKALRTALRDTQPQFAERLGVSLAVVGKWEARGSGQTLWPRYAEMMDTTYARLDARQRQRFTAALAASDPISIAGSRPMIAVNDAQDSAAEDEDVERRQFGAVIGAAALAAFPTGTLPRVGLGDARRIAAMVDDFVARDQLSGGASVLSEALDALEKANRSLEICDFESSAAEDAFTSAVGELAVRVGWLAFDADNPNLARRCYAEALALANVAGNDALTIHGCANSAMLAVNTGALRRARRFTARATDLTHGLPSGRIHALLAVRAATAHAALGDTAAFGRSITSAQREMDRAIEHEQLAECPAWLRFMSHNEVTFHEAKGLAFLGHHARAVDLYSQVAQQDDTPRNVACGSAQLAAALIAVGDVSAAVDVASPVLEQLGGPVASTRALRILEPVRAALSRQSGGDAGFIDHYDAVARHLETVSA